MTTNKKPKTYIATFDQPFFIGKDVTITCNTVILEDPETHLKMSSQIVECSDLDHTPSFEIPKYAVRKESGEE